MSATIDRPLSRKRVQNIGEQLANDRKLDLISFGAKRDQFTVSELTDALELPHTTAHEYCRDLHQVGLLERLQEKPATYRVVPFDIHLSLNAVVEAVESENQTLSFATDRYGDEIVDAVIEIWERVESGEYTYREASATLEMRHADFLRVASELELLE